MKISELQSIAQVYEEYLESVRSGWEQLIQGIEPKATQCGPVFEIENPLGRKDESFAIADMRAGEIALPHAHTNGESEIYLVIQGEGTTVVGDYPLELKIGKMAITVSETGHFTIPKKDLVLAVINTPPFQASNVVDIDPETDSEKYNFSSEQFSRYTKRIE